MKPYAFLLKYFVLVIVLFSAFTGCSRDDPEASDPVRIKYEVIVRSGNWYGEYIDETGEKACFCAQPLPGSGWTYSFEITEKPFILHIDATAEYNPGTPDAPDVTTSIYVNNELVISNTSNWAPGVASADYVVK